MPVCLLSPAWCPSPIFEYLLKHINDVNHKYSVLKNTVRCGSNGELSADVHISMQPLHNDTSHCLLLYVCSSCAHREHLMSTAMMKVGMEPCICDACRVFRIGGIREQ